MKLNSIELKNFRCFEQLKVDFNPEYTVLVGVNGAGKSTILDAAATALGSFIAGFDGIPANGISQDDVRQQTYELGSKIDTELQYPVEIECSGSVDGEIIAWKRSLCGKKRKTLIAGAKRIMDYGTKLQQKVRSGDTNTILPVIAYYGTGRLYKQKNRGREKEKISKSARTNGYITCLASASNEKMMIEWFRQMTSIQLQEGKELPELEAVKRAMGQCYSGVRNQGSHTEFKYSMKTNEIEMTFDSTEGLERLPMRMLSDGIRSTISMVADIAYRMAELNPQLLDRVTLDTPGIILIDELDMHLHPKWQMRIMEDLHYIFPKVQFIVTTHAPSILVNVKREHILMLEDKLVVEPANTTYGREISSVMREMMHVDVRPEEVRQMFSDFYEKLTDEKYTDAKGILSELEKILGRDDSDVVQAETAYEVETV